jgi:hypothetical protein
MNSDLGRDEEVIEVIEVKRKMSSLCVTIFPGAMNSGMKLRKAAISDLNLLIYYR